MQKTFKSVVLFCTSHERSSLLKDTLSGINYLKVFSCLEIDEVKQIVDMSSKTAILIDNPLIKGDKYFVQSKTGQFRRYFIDWDKMLDKQAIDDLAVDRISYFKSDDIQAVVEKLELYLHGKLRMFGQKDGHNDNTPIALQGKGFFTHLAVDNGVWKVLVSSHEFENDIDQLIGIRWDLLLNEVMQKGNQFDRPQSKSIGDTFFQVIFPHFTNGEVKRLSVVHIARNSQISDQLERVLQFLQKI